MKPLHHGNYRCGNCTQCNNTYKPYQFSHHHTGKHFFINSIITCASTHVIHDTMSMWAGLYWKNHKKTQRISLHKSSIRSNDPNYPIAIIFNNAHHDISSLHEQVTLPPRGGDHDKLLKQREAFWSYTLQTLAHKGDKLLFTSFLWLLRFFLSLVRFFMFCCGVSCTAVEDAATYVCVYITRLIYLCVPWFCAHLHM